MAEVTEASSSVYDLMKNLIGKHHPDLASVDKEIAIVMREKAAKSGGQVVLGKSRKAPGLLGVLGPVDYKFIIELAGDEWNNLTDRQREALLDECLCACHVDIDENSGELKCRLGAPDFTGFRDNLERYGIWRSPPADGGTLSPIEQMFGEG